MDAPAHVVVVNSRAEERDAIGRLLDGRGYRIDCCGSAAEALGVLGDSPAALLLVDTELCDMSGGAFLRAVEARGLHPPLIVTVPRMGVSRAVEAVRLGAIDIIERPIDGPRLARAVDRALTGR